MHRLTTGSTHATLVVLLGVATLVLTVAPVATGAGADGPGDDVDGPSIDRMPDAAPSLENATDDGTDRNSPAAGDVPDDASVEAPDASGPHPDGLEVDLTTVPGSDTSGTPSILTELTRRVEEGVEDASALRDGAKKSAPPIVRSPGDVTLAVQRNGAARAPEVTPQAEAPVPLDATSASTIDYAKTQPLERTATEPLAHESPSLDVPPRATLKWTAPKGPRMLQTATSLPQAEPSHFPLAVAVAVGAAGLAIVTFALYHLIRPHSLLQSKIRARIFAIICSRHGVTVLDLARELGVTHQTVAYHLHLLKRAEYVTDIKRGQKRIYFHNGSGLTEDDRRLMALASEPLTLRVLDVITKRPGITKTTLAGALNLSRTASNWHVRKLVALGIVREARNGGVCSLSPIPVQLARLRVLVTRVRAEGDDPPFAKSSRGSSASSS